jgi:hypothetical protein
MTYIDKILLNIVAQKSYELGSRVSPREANVLKSLATSVTGTYFITENQSKLLTKILKENHHHFGDMSPEIAQALADPTWSKPFRMIEQVKKLYIDYREESSPMLAIEFTFSANIRKILTQANREIEDLVQNQNGKLYNAALTEGNILTLVEVLQPLGFEIDDIIIKHYDIIKSWDEAAIRNQFLLTNMSNQNFLKHITADLGVTTPIDQNIIHDRSMRYRYLPGEALEQDGTLTRQLATRGKAKVWVDKTKHGLSDIVASLCELKRLPLMVVFDNYDASKANAVMNELADAFDQHDINNVGIYFRLQNDDNGIKFNELIANRQYNQYLGTDTQVVGVQSGKIPKFLLTSGWKPMSVLSIDSQLRNSKTAVYSSCCDLIITYTESPPIFEKSEKWL